MTQTETFTKEVKFKRIIKRTCDICGAEIHTGDDLIRIIFDEANRDEYYYRGNRYQRCDVYEVCGVNCMDILMDREKEVWFSDIYDDIQNKSDIISVTFSRTICNDEGEFRDFESEEEE